MRNEVKKFYRLRFSSSEKETKSRIWKILVRLIFQKYVKKTDTVLDLGAGYCEFINNIHCGKKIAVDLNPDTKKYANEDVEFIKTRADKIPNKLDGTIDIVFVSHFLEHLTSKNEIIVVLSRVNRLLKKGGKIMILQPNIDLVHDAYWDFIDHGVPLNTKSLREALENTGFKIDKFVIRFLPYTTKSRLAKYGPAFLEFYLFLPQLIRPFSGQSFVVAKKI